MSNNCIYIKKPFSLCNDNGKKTYIIDIIKPGTICEYTQDQKIEENCNPNTDECNIESNQYVDVIKCIIKNIINEFIKKFNDGPGNCSSDKIINQYSEINIARDENGNVPDMSTCKITVNQNAQITSNKVCVDINSRLANLQGDEKKYLINSILDEVFTNKISLFVKSKSLFINKCKDIFFDKLINIDATITSGCSQNIYIDQDRSVYFFGNVKCKNSTFTFSQDAIIESYMRCVTEPILDDIINNVELKRLFNITQISNKDCIYDKVLISGCDGNERKYKINILVPQMGNGTCEYNENQIINEICSNKECETTEWSNWSDCAGDNLNSTIGIQTRTRKLKKDENGNVIGNGDNCPPFFEKRVCNISKRKRLNSNQNIQDTLPPILKNIYGYEWLLYGPKYLTSTQKILISVIIVVFIFLWIYILFK
jgi:hypothetical protein